MTKPRTLERIWCQAVLYLACPHLRLQAEVLVKINGSGITAAEGHWSGAGRDSRKIPGGLSTIIKKLGKNSVVWQEEVRLA